MKKIIRFSIYGFVLLLGLTGGYFAQKYFTEQNAKIEAETIELAYLHWYLNIRTPSNVDEEMVAFLSHLDRRGEVDVTNINFGYQDGKVYLFYLATNHYYAVCQFGVESMELDGEFVIIDIDKNFEKLTKKYHLDQSNSFYYQLDQDNNPIKTTYNLTYLDETDKIIASYQITHGRKITLFPKLDGIGLPMTEIDDLLYVTVYDYVDLNDELFDFEQPIYNDTIVKAKSRLETGVAYNGFEVFDSLEEALISEKDECFIVLLKDYTASKLTIPQNVTLFIPATSSHTSTLIDGTNSHSSRYVSNLQYVTLTVDEMIVEGTLQISGIIGVPQSSGYYQGHTSGSYGQLIVNTKLTVLGFLEVGGYIKGNGMMEVTGSVYAPFVVKDYRGGTNTVGTFDTAKIAPFSVYEMPNIELVSYYYDTAILGGYARLVTYNAYNKTSAVIIGQNGMITLKPGAFLKSVYDPLSAKTILTINGGAQDGSFAITLLGMKVTIDNVYFPIHHGFELVFENGTYDFGQSYKVMTGAKITIKEDAIVNLNDKNIIYESFKDVAYGGFVYPDKSAAQFDVYGTLNVNYAMGGQINVFDGAIVNIASTAELTVTSIEGNYSDSSGFTQVAAITETLILNYYGTKTVAEKGQSYQFPITS